VAQLIWRVNLLLDNIILAYINPYYKTR